MTEPSLPSTDARFYLERAYARDGEGGYEQALAECDTALSIDPSLAEAHNLRGLLLEELDRKSEALAAFDQALELDPGLDEARLNRSELFAEQQESLLQEAWALLMDGDAAAALGRSEATIALAPENARAHNLRGLALEEMGLLPEAADAYHRALELEPALSDAAANLQDLGAALPLDAERAHVPVEAPEPRTRRRRLRGVLYGLLTFVLIASMLFSLFPHLPRLLRTAGNPELAEDLNAEAAALHRQGDLEKAIEVYTEAIETAPDLVAARYNRGLAYYQQGDLGRAVADMSRAIELAPDVPDLHATLGIFFQERGETGQAITSHSRAIELDPGFGPAYYYRALAYIVVEDSEGAIADLESFLAVSSETRWRTQAEALLQSLRSEQGQP